VLTSIFLSSPSFFTALPTSLLAFSSTRFRLELPRMTLTHSGQVRRVDHRGRTGQRRRRSAFFDGFRTAFKIRSREGAIVAEHSFNPSTPASNFLALPMLFLPLSRHNLPSSPIPRSTAFFKIDNTQAVKYTTSHPTRKTRLRAILDHRIRSIPASFPHLSSRSPSALLATSTCTPTLFGKAGTLSRRSTICAIRSRY